MPGVCYTFGWPYSIERSCHENFLSCGSLLLTSTNADADNQLAVYSFDGIHWSAASRIHTIHTVLAIFSTFNPICMFIYLFTSASSISTTTHNSYAIRFWPAKKETTLYQIQFTISCVAHTCWLLCMLVCVAYHTYYSASIQCVSV